MIPAIAGHPVTAALEGGCVYQQDLKLTGIDKVSWKSVAKDRDTGDALS